MSLFECAWSPGEQQVEERPVIWRVDDYRNPTWHRQILHFLLSSATSQDSHQVGEEAARGVEEAARGVEEARDPAVEAILRVVVAIHIDEVDWTH